MSKQYDRATPLTAVAARKRLAAERREAEALELRREADELDLEAERRLASAS